MKLPNITEYGSHRDWLIAACVAVGVYFGLRLIGFVITRYISSMAKRESIETDDFVAQAFISRTKPSFLLIFALYAGCLYLRLPKQTDRLVGVMALIALFLQFGFWGNGIITYWFSQRAKKKAEEDPGSASAYSVINFLSKAALWSLIIILLLDNLGVDITAFIAGLGIGGVAVALAVQNILGDLFASISIALDKPFVVGDFIIIDDLMGTVEHIGIKTTRVHSLSGEQLIFSNNDLLKSRIRNFKRMYERRVLFQIGVTYETPYEKVAAIPTMIKEIIESLDQTRFDRAHFFKYGDFALIFEVVYYVLVPDYNVYMDRQQSINLAIYRRFAEEGIEFAYPTQTVHLKKPEDKS